LEINRAKLNQTQLNLIKKLIQVQNNFIFQFEFDLILLWTRLLGWTKLNVKSIGTMPYSLTYTYNLHKPHKVCIILTFASTSSLYWLGRRSVICMYPPFFWHRRSSPCSDSDLQLRAFLPLIHQCEFSTSFLSLQIKLEFCYEQIQ
jgi:hypothetical protein